MVNYEINKAKVWESHEEAGSYKADPEKVYEPDNYEADTEKKAYECDSHLSVCPEIYYFFNSKGLPMQAVVGGLHQLCTCKSVTISHLMKKLKTHAWNK